MALDINASEISSSIASLINDLGVPVTLTKVDTGQTFKTKGAFAAVKTTPPNTSKASLILNRQTKLFLAAGRFTPMQGDLITMTKQDYRVLTVETIYLAGGVVAHALELT